MKFSEESQRTKDELKSIRSIFPYQNHFVTLSHPSAKGDFDGEVHYIDEGKKDGVPILFVHGNPTWSFYFRKVIANLKPDFRCIAIDHMGCGLSEKFSDQIYDLKSRGIFLGRFLDHLGIDKCHLVVHDWGGAIGMSHATRFPDRVASVTITNTAAYPCEWISWRIQTCRLPIVGRWINYYFNGFLRAAMHMTTVKPIPKDVKTGYLLPYRKLRSRESIDQFVKDIAMDDSHPSYSELKRVGEGLSQFHDDQMLILWGLKDFCFAPYFLEKWKTYFPKAKTIVFEDADHFLFEEKQDECSEAIRSHILGNQ